MTSKNSIVDICIYIIVDIHNDIFTSQNVFLDIQSYILDIWNSFSFRIQLQISRMFILDIQNVIVDI